ncbi:uncharacterized protein LOC122019086 [Zingiber officinale]|uniref:uncharacterized protein LOC122019086 n=1 Tax=Zingiber officinale TaxID=94328 RepID=UPI001C4CC4DA|nr:uncharacterized protein LOC122019086 [Zingiber officinale]
MFRVGLCLTGRFEHTGDEFQAIKKCQSFDSYQQRSAAVVTGLSGDKNVVGGAGEDLNQKKSRPLPNAASSLEPGVRVADKNVVTEMKEQDKAVGFTFPGRYQDIVEVIHEIKNQFDGASASADHVAKLFEVGKFFYHHKNSEYKVSARIICGLSPLSTSKMDDLLVIEEDEVIGTGYLSSTLQKIYNWELKLLEEVMAEEKMMVLYNRKCKQLNRLSKNVKWVQRLKSWSQLKCSSESYLVKLNDHMDEIKRLEMPTVDLAAHFSGWVTAPRSYLKSLNDWLMKGVCSVPEETDDDIAAPSPLGKLGAPSIFVVCNYWSESVDVISERNVVGAMKDFAHIVFKLWQQHSLEQ